MSLNELKASSELKLWRYNEITGYWDYIRNVSPENAERWLAIWRTDEPQARFVVGKRRPRQ